MQSSRVLNSICRRIPLPIGGARQRLPNLPFRPQPQNLRLFQRSAFPTRPLHHLPKARGQIWRTRPNQRIRNNSSKSTNATAQEEGSKAPQSLSARFKELSRKYGWAAVGVYFGLSALDFPFCYLAVRLVGPDRIGEVEHAIVDGFWNLVAIVAPSMAPEKRKAIIEAESDHTPAIPSDVESNKVKENASTWPPSKICLCYYTNCTYRYLDPAAPRVWPSQVTHLLSGPSYRCRDAQDCQNVEELGLQHRAPGKSTESAKVTGSKKRVQMYHMNQPFQAIGIQIDGEANSTCTYQKQVLLKACLCLP